MKDLNYQNNLLICFIESESFLLTGLVFESKNDFSFMYLVTCDEKSKNITLIKNAASSNKTNFLICYTGIPLILFFGCITYNSINKCRVNHMNLLIIQPALIIILKYII